MSSRVSRRAALGWSLVAPLASFACVGVGDTALAESLDDVRFTAWGAEALSYLTLPPYYLTTDELRALPLPPPPPNSSPTTRAELDGLLQLQSTRTSVEVAAIVRHLDYAPMCTHFVSTAGRNLASMPRTRALLDRVMLDVRCAVFQSKKRFARARPDRLDARIHPCIPVPPHPAYPSSHAALGYMLGRVLGALALERERDPLAALGREIATERELAGVHYPSDGVAGRSLAEGAFLRLEGNARFVADLRLASSEWPAPDAHDSQ